MPITITVQRTLPASPAAAFALTIDPARFPFPGYGPIAAIGKVVLDAPLAVGSLRRIYNADGTVLTERVTVLEPPHRHAYELSGFTAPFSWLVRLGEAEWRVEPVDGGAAVTWRYRFTLTSFLAYPVAAVLLMVFMRGAMNRCLAAMAAILAADGAR